MTMEQRPGRLEGRKALITGASSGIGAATARRFVEEGAKVALLARRQETLADLADELGTATVCVADVSRRSQVDDAIARAAEAMDGMDIVVNAAGVAQPALLEDTSDESWEEMIGINLTGVFYVCRAAVPFLRRGDSPTIVNLGSELSLVGLGMCVSYCAAKFGVLGVTKALAAELAPDITVNAVCPGPVDTPLLAGELALFPDAEKAMEETIGRVPLRRLAKPEEVASAIAYLVSEAEFATGSSLVLDGGVTAI